MKVTKENIKEFNKLYYELKTFAAVARATGFSASTISKYVDRNWKPVDENAIVRFKLEDIPEFKPETFEGLENWNSLTLLSNEEKEEMKKIWEEIEI